MNITLKGTEVQNLNFNKVNEQITDDEIEFSCSTAYSDEDNRLFIVIFDLSLLSKEGFSLSISYVAYFETDNELNDDFKGSHFPTVNAPAIAYPFLRSFISTLTVNAGYTAILIPTVNFQALAKIHTAK